MKFPQPLPSAAGISDLKLQKRVVQAMHALKRRNIPLVILQSDDLLAVARVGQDFLVAGHGSVEHHLSDRCTWGTNGITNIDSAVCERQDGGRGGSLKRQKHGVLRVSYGYAQCSSGTYPEKA